jgi:hypothetical protein
MMAGALRLVPRLGETVLGKQEAMLRELLRLFREGHVEQALRRALPMGKDASRGATAAEDSNLPHHDTRYSLRNLLTGSRPARIWYGGAADTYRQLEAEYRKQAAEAVARGDFRRAAFIYGKLLGDFRSAANALTQGGLHRDAAVIYLEMLHDTLAAARALEAAGELERALQLYRQRGDHLPAAELLRRLGEEEQALDEFQAAARQLVRQGRGQGEAGDLLLNRAGRPDLALPFFLEGWAERPSGSYLLCGHRLLQLYARADAAADLFALIDEADRFFAPAQHDQAAAGFYNNLARLADTPELAPQQEEMRDRALRGLADKVRHQAAQGIPAARVVANLFGNLPCWTPALVSDARFAVQAAAKKQPAPAPRAGASLVKIPAATPTVTAVCFAPVTGALFIGFASGEVVRFHPKRCDVVTITNEHKPVLSLATDPQGETLVVLSRQHDEDAHLSSYSRSVGYRMLHSQVLQASHDPWLAPLLGDQTRTEYPRLLLLWNGNTLDFLTNESLLPFMRWGQDRLPAPPQGLLPLPTAGVYRGKRGLLIWSDGRGLYYPDRQTAKPQEIDLGWVPSIPPGNSLRHPHFSWIFEGSEELELAGLGLMGTLQWSKLRLCNERLVLEARRVNARHGPFLTAALIRPGLIVAVTKTTAYWFSPTAQGFRILDEASTITSNTIACFAFNSGGVLVLMGVDGVISLLSQRRF